MCLNTVKSTLVYLSKSLAALINYEALVEVTNYNQSNYCN